MPIQIDHAESRVSILGLTDAQLDELVALVAARLAEQRDDGRSRQGVPRRSILEPLEVRG